MTHNSSRSRIAGTNQGYSQGEGGGAADLFNIVSLEQLDSSSQKRVERAISQIAPEATIIGVHVTPRFWDLRPIIVVPGEGRPSIIRCLGPEISLAENISARMQELLNNVSSDKELAEICQILEWGAFEGQLYYRRYLVDSTLAEDFQNTQGLDFKGAVTLAQNIVDVVDSLHSRGIVHGHIASSNVAVLNSGKVALIDAGAGLAIAQASSALGVEAFPSGYFFYSFAPETLLGEIPGTTADVFGLGLVLGELFSRLAELGESNESITKPDRVALHIINGALSEMCDETPKNRPSIAQVKALLSETLANVDKPAEVELRETAVSSEKDTGGNGESVSVVGTGKIIRTPSTVLLPPSTKDSVPLNATEVSSSAETSANVTAKPVSLSDDTEIVADRVAETTDVSSSHPLEMPQELPGQASRKSIASFSAERAPVREYVPRPKDVIEGGLEEYKEPTEAVGSVEKRIPPTHAHVGRPSKTSVSILATVLLICVIVGIMVFRNGELDPEQIASYSNDELESNWNSKRPSLMSIVARAALNGAYSNPFAESLIISSAIRGDELGESVDASLLRIAFDEQWEAQLTESDRKLALTLALTKLLRDNIPAELPELQDVHPGVLLAIAVSAGSNVARVLKNVPAEVLGELPPPIGPAFIKIISADATISCGDTVIRDLARFVTGGIADSEQLLGFVSHDFSTRLQALAVLFSADDTSIRQILTVLLEHPNVRLNDPAVLWARTWQLNQWSELTDADKLYLLAGTKPLADPDVANLGKMFAHPSPDIRGMAIKSGLEKIKFNHPGAYAVLSRLSENPSLLQPKQTVQLAQFLERPNSATAEAVRAWLDSSPATEILSVMLLSTSGNSESSLLDFELARHLQDHAWEPNVSELHKLIAHPENLARLYGYSRTFMLADVNTAREILTKAIETEKHKVFVDQLKVMLANLEDMSKEGVEAVGEAN